jgi:3',5'-cyclic AMP phosphodiesterase CpdA
VTPEVSTVADDEVVLHVGAEVRRYQGLAPGREHDLDGVVVRTLDRPGGEHLCTFATINDVHFGERRCGVVEGSDIGPVLESVPGEPPYPEVMNAAAVAEITELDPVAVVAKGDLTADGTAAEWARFTEVWGGAFGDRLHYVRGNHDAMTAGIERGLDGIPLLLDLPGARVALVDTVVPGVDGGRLTADQLDWLDDVAATAEVDDVPLLAMGHHPCWDPRSATRPADFGGGINPDDSEALVAVAARRPAFRGWFAGHTHRNRVRRFPTFGTGDVPFVEVACLKDFPGSWAEYRVFEGGVLQVHRRLSTPEALGWSERCRALYEGLYTEYAFGNLSDRCFALPPAR